MQATQTHQEWAKDVLKQVIGVELLRVAAHSESCVSHYRQREVTEVNPDCHATQEADRAHVTKASLCVHASDSCQNVGHVVNETN